MLSPKSFVFSISRRCAHCLRNRVVAYLVEYRASSLSDSDSRRSRREQGRRPIKRCSLRSWVDRRIVVEVVVQVIYGRVCSVKGHSRERSVRLQQRRLTPSGSGRVTNAALGGTSTDVQGADVVIIALVLGSGAGALDILGLGSVVVTLDTLRRDILTIDILTHGCDVLGAARCGRSEEAVGESVAGERSKM
jgi:hypothetical protein